MHLNKLIEYVELNKLNIVNSEEYVFWSDDCFDSKDEYLKYSLLAITYCKLLRNILNLPENTKVGFKNWFDDNDGENYIHGLDFTLPEGGSFYFFITHPCNNMNSKKLELGIFRDRGSDTNTMYKLIFNSDDQLNDELHNHLDEINKILVNQIN